MNLDSLKDKPIFQMTGEEFLFLQNKLNLQTQLTNVQPKKQNSHVYGILGIAKLFGCSRASANRIKKSGIISDAIIQNGRKIITNSEQALALMKAHHAKQKT